jgi:hypothetical protein
MNSLLRVSLTDGTVTLRPWRPHDWRAVFDACQDELIARFVPIPLPYTEDSARDFIALCDEGWASGRERPFADPSTGEVLGAIGRHAPVGAPGRARLLDRAGSPPSRRRHEGAPAHRGPDPRHDGPHQARALHAPGQPPGGAWVRTAASLLYRAEDHTGTRSPGGRRLCRHGVSRTAA